MLLVKGDVVELVCSVIYKGYNINKGIKGIFLGKEDEDNCRIQFPQLSVDFVFLPIVMVKKIEE